MDSGEPEVACDEEPAHCLYCGRWECKLPHVVSPEELLQNARTAECNYEDYGHLMDEDEDDNDDDDEDKKKEKDPIPEEDDKDDEVQEVVGSKRKRQERDKHIQGQLDIDLRKAAANRPLRDVKRALLAGGRINAVCIRHQCSPLIKACRRDDDYAVAEQIVRFLIANGASVFQACSVNKTPLHWACEMSSAAVVQVLLDEEARVNARDKDGWTPVFLAAARNDDQAHCIVQLLLEHRAEVYTCDTKNRTMPLLQAAEMGTAATLKLLLNSCSLEMSDIESKDTALIAAARNIRHGAAMIPLILDKNKHEKNYITRQASDGHDALLDACKCGNTEAVKALKAAMLMQPLPIVRAQAQAEVPFTFRFEVADPLGTLDEAASLGYQLSPDEFNASAVFSETLAWVSLRRTVWDVDAVWRTMHYCRSYKTWHWVGIEMLNVRHPLKGTTLLHVAAMGGIAEGLAALTDLWANPFIRDAKGRVPVQRTTDKDCISLLTAYARQQYPRREIIRWYGPCFLSRAQTWMLCALHWRRKGVRSLPKDVTFFIVRKLMEIEVV
jgi:ankyrin repeat protein